MAEGHEPQPLGVSEPITPDPTNYPYVKYVTYGKLVVIFASVTVSGGEQYFSIAGFPPAPAYTATPIVNDTGYADINSLGEFGIRSNTAGTHFAYATMVYIRAD